jgi:hypothetical protein
MTLFPAGPTLFTVNAERGAIKCKVIANVLQRVLTENQSACFLSKYKNAASESGVQVGFFVT